MMKPKLELFGQSSAMTLMATTTATIMPTNGQSLRAAAQGIPSNGIRAGQHQLNPKLPTPFSVQLVCCFSHTGLKTGAFGPMNVATSSQVTFNQLFLISEILFLFASNLLFQNLN